MGALLTARPGSVLVIGADDAARELAERLALPHVPRAEMDALEVCAANLLLLRVGDRLTLRRRAQPDRGGCHADFLPLLRTPAQSREPLLRAVGERHQVVFDATAGFGEDAMRLASAGKKVIACERNAILHALFEDGLRRLRSEGGAPGEAIASRVTLHHGDAAEVLACDEPAVDAISLDPMYPAPAGRKPRALPPLAMQLARLLVGEEDNAATLLEAARATTAPRIIVKRPHHAPPVADDVAFTITSKLVRFDCFVRSGRGDIPVARS